MISFRFSLVCLVSRRRCTADFPILVRPLFHPVSACPFDFEFILPWLFPLDSTLFHFVSLFCFSSFHAVCIRLFVESCSTALLSLTSGAAAVCYFMLVRGTLHFYLFHSLDFSAVAVTLFLMLLSFSVASQFDCGALQHLFVRARYPGADFACRNSHHVWGQRLSMRCQGVHVLGPRTLMRSSSFF